MNTTCICILRIPGSKQGPVPLDCTLPPPHPTPLSPPRCFLLVVIMFPPAGIEVYSSGISNFDGQWFVRNDVASWIGSRGKYQTCLRECQIQIYNTTVNKQQQQCDLQINGLGCLFSYHQTVHGSRNCSETCATALYRLHWHWLWAAVSQAFVQPLAIVVSVFFAEFGSNVPPHQWLDPTGCILESSIREACNIHEIRIPESASAKCFCNVLLLDSMTVKFCIPCSVCTGLIQFYAFDFKLFFTL